MWQQKIELKDFQLHIVFHCSIRVPQRPTTNFSRACFGIDKNNFYGPIVHWWNTNNTDFIAIHAIIDGEHPKWTLQILYKTIGEKKETGEERRRKNRLHFNQTRYLCTPNREIKRLDTDHTFRTNFFLCPAFNLVKQTMLLRPEDDNMSVVWLFVYSH